MHGIKMKHRLGIWSVGVAFSLLWFACTAATPPALTIKSPDGDIVDCINIKDQPAFDHPLLQNHTILEKPAYLPNIVTNKDDGIWQIWHGNGTQCPEGTIPIRRLNEITGSQLWREATSGRDGHEYAVGRLDSPPQAIYGTKATMNVWRPKVEQTTEFSLAQIWLTSGSYDDNTLNSIEAGWQVCPVLYTDHQPRLFIFWTADAYASPACYNLRCPGFVQTSRTVLIEGAISPTSTIGGHQTELTIHIWKDPASGPWWLGVGFNNGTNLSPIGYWPVEIFSRLTDHAESVQWGGEIVDNYALGRHTSTEMGSGYRPPSDKAAYMHDLQVAVKPGEFLPVSRLLVLATNSTYYTVEKYSNSSFAYGGPAHGTAYGGPAHGAALRVRLDLIPFYLCFVSFLFF